MTKNRTPTPVYLDPGMHPGLEVKGLTSFFKADTQIFRYQLFTTKIILYPWKLEIVKVIHFSSVILFDIKIENCTLYKNCTYNKF